MSESAASRFRVRAPDPASRRDLVRAPRDHAAGPRPERASPRPRRRGRDTPLQRRVLAHRNRRTLTARLRPEQARRRQANCVKRPPRGTLSTTTPEPLIDTRFPGNSSRGERRHVPRPPPAHRFGTVTDLRRPAKPSSPPARPPDGACACAGLRLSRPAPRAERRCSRSSSRSASCCERPAATSGTRSRTISLARSSSPATGTTPCDRPEGHRRRQDDGPRTCAAPAGGRLLRPTRPPPLTTRPGGSLEQPAENTSMPATLLPLEVSGRLPRIDLRWCGEDRRYSPQERLWYSLRRPETGKLPLPNEPHEREHSTRCVATRLYRNPEGSASVTDVRGS